jgi:putative ABC transport system permease protein
MRYSEVTALTPVRRRPVAYVLAQPAPGEPVEAVCARIHAETGLLALTRSEFLWRTMRYYFFQTSIPKNFFVTFLFAFIAGGAFVGQTYYSFILENLRPFATLKALGITNRQLLWMVLLQCLAAGALGCCLGLGLAAGYGVITKSSPIFSELAFFMPWHIGVLTAVMVTIMVVLGSFFGLRRVLLVDPEMVFRS